MGHRNNGMTLVEVLVTLTILGILAVSIYTVFKSGLDAWSKAKTRLEIYQNARVIIDQLTKELQGAFVGGGATFTGTDGTTDAVEFVANILTSEKYAPNFKYEVPEIFKIHYYVDEATHILKRDSIKNPADYTSTVYTDSIDFGFMVSNIQFQYLAVGSANWTATPDTLPDAVKISLTLVDSDNNLYPFETKVHLPNAR